MITYGLCCICNALAREGFAFRTMTYRRFCEYGTRAGLAELSQRAAQNAALVGRIVARLPELGIGHYRITSNLFPLLTHPQLRLAPEDLPDFPAIRERLARTGATARARPISFSMHPGPYAVLPSQNAAVRENTLRDLELHGKILDMLGAPRSPEAPIHLHMGTSAALDTLPQRFDAAFARLTQVVRPRLAFENDDKGYWNARRLLEFLRPRNLPMTFDFLHDACNPSAGETPRALFLEAAATWGTHRPVFHYAESRSAATPRAHADFVAHPPPDYGIDAVCELEAKAKDDAIARLRAVGATPHNRRPRRGYFTRVSKYAAM